MRGDGVVDGMYQLPSLDFSFLFNWYIFHSTWLWSNGDIGRILQNLKGAFVWSIPSLVHFCFFPASPFRTASKYVVYSMAGFHSLVLPGRKPVDIG